MKKNHLLRGRKEEKKKETGQQLRHYIELEIKEVEI